MEWQEIEDALKYLLPPFPRAPMEEARQRWEEWAPRFIAAIQRVADGGSPFLDELEEEYDGIICFAAWLAAEKRDTRAYAPLTRACHCPPERAEAIFGDDLTEGLGRQLASVCDGDSGPLRALAEDRDAAMWCRLAGLQAQFTRVVEGEGDHDELLDWLTEFCVREAEVMRRGEWDFEREPIDLLTWAVDILGGLGPSESILENIRGWFNEDLIDTSVSSLAYFENQAARSAEACLAEAREAKNNRYVRDAIGDMEWWACFQEQAVEDFDDALSLDPQWLDRIMPAVDIPNLIHPVGTVRREMPKVGRNDPCPCGSGKKYKKCCGKEDGAAADETEKGVSAARLAIDWLARHHEDAMRDALGDMLEEAIDEEDRDALAGLDQDTWGMIQANALEWLLTEGWIEYGDVFIPVAELLLGRKGPSLSAGQRRWIEVLSTRPLRLYEVTETVPDVGMTLCDALDLDAPPVVVLEKSGSRAARAGMMLAARIVPVGDHHELSGAVYPFANLHVAGLIEELQKAVSGLAENYPDNLPATISEIIRRHWLAQYLRPAPLPSVVDSYSGDLLLFMTDRYRVHDWVALEQTLAAQPDIDGDRESGWSRIMECEDGQIRKRATFEAGKAPDTLEVAYHTQRYADEGRPWFEALAGDAVEFVGRDIKDPKVSMMLAAAGGAAPTITPSPTLPPDALAEAIEQTLHRFYANWADEPIPALGNRAPRQAIGTPAGLERVKGLLRSYEADEKRMAEEEGRREVSFDFLWESLDLRRE